MKVIITLCIAILLLYSCGNHSSDQRSGNEAETLYSEKPTADYAESADSSIQIQGDKKYQPRKPADPDPDWDKKIIRTATLDVEVNDFKGYYSRLREQVKGLGGYIAAEEQSENDWRIENMVTIKVPVAQFENAVFQLTSDVVKLNAKQISSEDVTGAYADTRSRMEAKKRVRDRYISLLSQAKNMEDILSVQSEINNIQVEIESATGRIAYLGQASSFSTIRLNYYQVLNPGAKATDNPGFGSKVANAFRTGWSWLGDLLVGLVSVWPIVLLIFGAIVMIRKRRTPKKTQPVDL